MGSNEVCAQSAREREEDLRGEQEGSLAPQGQLVVEESSLEVHLVGHRGPRRSLSLPTGTTGSGDSRIEHTCFISCAREHLLKLSKSIV